VRVIFLHLANRHTSTEKQANNYSMAARDVCAACGKTAAQSRCSACRKVAYCSRSCQKSHWKTHKPECTQDCVLVYSGEIEDGGIRGVHGFWGDRKTEFTFRETLSSRKMIAEWADQVRGSRLLDGLIARHETQKLALRNDWRCICGAPATRIVSDAGVCMVSQLRPIGNGAPSKWVPQFNVRNMFCLARCERPNCVAIVDERLVNCIRAVRAASERY
jgi:hypothetical protein